MRAAILAQRPNVQLRPEEVEAFVVAGGMARDAVAVRPLVAEVDRLRTAYQDAVLGLAWATSAFDLAAVRSWVAAAGGRVTGETFAVSTVAARVPVGQVDRLASSPMVALVGSDVAGRPELEFSGPALGAPTFWQDNVTSGEFDFGVLDTGVYRAHPAFSGFRWETNAGLTDGSGHGTHVAGIMGSKDQHYRGMAWGADTVSVAIAGAGTTSMVGMNYLVTGVRERAEAVNYSFGNGTADTSDYRPIDQFFDGVCDTFGIAVSKSTGNGGFSSGAPTITHPAPAFNLMAVASVSDTGDTNRPNDRISSYSSTGPTVGGRKKPDLAFPGENIV